jgi:hypothetical protein
MTSIVPIPKFEMWPTIAGHDGNNCGVNLGTLFVEDSKRAKCLTVDIRRGQDSHTLEAQKRLLHRAIRHRAADLGVYGATMESAAV